MNYREDAGEIAGADSSATVTQKVHAQLRAEILSGALKPGDKLKLEEMRERYGASVNTLREVLSRMVPEGLVANEGQRGFQVIPATLADLKDITEMRRLLECHAARLAVARADLDWEAGLVAAYHKLSRVEAVVESDPEKYGQTLEDYNREFHAALVSACGSPWLLHFRSVMYDQSLRYRMLAFRVRNFPRDRSRQEHKQILDAALARDGDGLATLLAAHISKGAELYSEGDLEPRSKTTAPKSGTRNSAATKPRGTRTR